MNCQEVKNLFLESPDAKEAEKDQALASHLEACKSCREFLAFQKKISEGFGHMATQAPPAALTDRICKIPQKASGNSEPSLWESLSLLLKPSFALSMACLLLFGAFFTFKFQLSTPSSPTKQKEASDVSTLARVEEKARSTPAPEDLGAATPEKPFASGNFQMAMNTFAPPPSEVRDQVTRSSEVDGLKSDKSGFSQTLLAGGDGPSSSEIPTKPARTEKSEAKRVPDPEPAAAPHPVQAEERESGKKVFDLASAKGGGAAPSASPIAVGEPLLSKSLIETKAEAEQRPEGIDSDKKEILAYTADEEPRRTSESLLPPEGTEDGFAEMNESAGVSPQPSQRMKISAAAPVMARVSEEAASGQSIEKARKDARPQRDFRHEQLEVIVKAHQSEIKEGPLDIDQWVLSRWVTSQERIRLNPDPGTIWMAKKQAGRWTVFLAPQKH